MPNLSRIHPDLELRVSKQARRMALRLDTKKRVVYLVVPSRTRADKAYKFAWEHREWINTHINGLPAPVPFADGAVLPIYGKKVRVRINYDPGLRVTSIRLEDNRLLVDTNKEDPTARIERFLKDHARRTLEELSHRKAARIRRKIKRVAVRDTKSRWGSCNEDGELSYSWRLIFAPRAAMDYVVAHEIAHLAYLDHSPRFWDVCRRLSFSYSKGKSWMQEHGHTLMRFGAVIE
jgi:predicted metal-dependent hydrolase